MLTAGGWLGLLKSDGTSMLQEHHYDLPESVLILPTALILTGIRHKEVKSYTPWLFADTPSSIAKAIRRWPMRPTAIVVRKSPHRPNPARHIFLCVFLVKETESSFLIHWMLRIPTLRTYGVRTPTRASQWAKGNAIGSKTYLAETIPAASIGLWSIQKSNSKRCPGSPLSPSTDELTSIQSWNDSKISWTKRMNEAAARELPGQPMD